MRNLEVIVEGKTVDLSSELGFDLELRNPCMGFDAAVGSFAVDLTLADTAKNRNIFGRPGDPKVRNDNRQFYCELAQKGNVIEKGWLRYKDGGGSLKFNFTSGLSEFFGVYQSKLLSEIDLGTIAFPTWNDVVGYTWNSGGFAMPTVANDSFYDKNAPVGYSGKVNDYVSGSYTSSTKVPMFFLKKILKQVGDLAGVSFKGNYWDSAMLEATLIYNTKSLDGETAIEVRKHLPDLTIGGLIMALRKTYDLAVFFDVKKKVIRMDYMKDVLKGACTMNWSKKLKVLRGTPVYSDGLELIFGVDSGEGLNKDIFFDNYLTAGNEEFGGRIKIDTAVSSLVMQSGVLTTKQVGISPTGSNTDKKFSLRLIYKTSGAGGSNEFGGVKLKWGGSDGLVNAFWKAEEAFRMKMFSVVDNGNFNAVDFANVGRIFRGESDEFPIIHADGVNYFLEALSIASDKKNIGKITAWRL